MIDKQKSNKHSVEIFIDAPAVLSPSQNRKVLKINSPFKRKNCGQPKSNSFNFQTVEIQKDFHKEIKPYLKKKC
jgi:hypothetical protein